MLFQCKLKKSRAQSGVIGTSTDHNRAHWLIENAARLFSTARYADMGGGCGATAGFIGPVASYDSNNGAGHKKPES